MKSMTLTFLMNKRPHNLAGLSLKNDKWLSNWWGPLLSFGFTVDCSKDFHLLIF